MRVYFAESDGEYWIKRFLKPGFSHCFIVTAGVLINPCFHFTNVVACGGVYESTVFLDVDYSEPKMSRRSILQPFTCVTIVKSILGINNSGIITPYQLFKHLEANPNG